jgi:mannosyl-oligosaccharide alpha-1,2-mannosidase
MDLRPQFARAMDHVAAMNYTQAQHEIAPFFETIIRYLGGLLSAYALIADNGATSSLRWQPVPYPAGPVTASWTKAERLRISNILLTRADHLARALLPAFNTSSGLPVWGVNTQR